MEDVSPQSDQSTSGVTRLRKLTVKFMESTKTLGTDQSLHAAMVALIKMTKARSN